MSYWKVIPAVQKRYKGKKEVPVDSPTVGMYAFQVTSFYGFDIWSYYLQTFVLIYNSFSCKS